MFQGEVVALHEACQDPTDRESCWVTRREDELPKRSIVSECHRGRPAPRSRESGCGIVSVSAQVTKPVNFHLGTNLVGLLIGPQIRYQIERRNARKLCPHSLL